MTCRVDSTLIAGACVVGDRGLGVLGSFIRSTTATGAHGAGYLYNDWQSGDDAKEFRGLIVTPPASGTLVAEEDGSFDFTAPGDGSYSFTYRLFVDGVDLGTAVASFTVGTASGVTASVAGTGAITYTGTGAVVGTVGAAVVAVVAGTGTVTYTGTAAVVGSVNDPGTTAGTAPDARTLRIRAQDRVMTEEHDDQPIARSALLNWAWDWADWLNAGDSIASQVIAATDGLTPSAVSASGGVVSALIACGAEAPIGSRQRATCTITTSAGLTDSRSIRLVVAAR